MVDAKGKDSHGVLDNVTSAVNRGTAAAGRSADRIKLNARIGELNKQRQGLAVQLGGEPVRGHAGRQRARRRARGALRGDRPSRCRA